MEDGDVLIKRADAWPPLVPGLVVSDLERSVQTYTTLFGFEEEFVEPGRRAVLRVETAVLLLTVPESGGPTEEGSPAVPVGHGVTLHLRVGDPRAVYERLRGERYPIAVPMELSEYDDGDGRVTRSTFTVADPDGYLIQFSD